MAHLDDWPISADRPSLMVAPSLAKLKFIGTLRFTWLVAYFAMCASLFITTLLGLHYLIDRMHRE